MPGMDTVGDRGTCGDPDAVGQLKNLRITPMDDDIIEELEDDDNELQDDDEVGEVIVGFVEKPKTSWSLLRQYFPSKAGGTPAWLNPVNLPSGNATLCDVCGQPLSFLLQVYAPISEDESDSAFHRTLFLFICPTMTCLLRDQHEHWKRGQEKTSRSVKVFRSQLPLVNPFYSNKPPSHDGATQPSCSGVPLCSWCGTWKGDKVCSVCRKARYCSQKHQGMHWRSGHNTNCQESILASSPMPACNTLWPEFELKQAPESEFDAEMTDKIVNNNSLIGHIQSSDNSMASLLDTFQADEEKQCWASFQDRISKFPEQVLRYCRDDGAKPLWPMISGRPSTADIPKCRHCNGLLKFEFQIMPQLLYYFGVKNDTDSLDWATIVVYTCEASCEAGGTYREEYPWVQLWSQSASSQ